MIIIDDLFVWLPLKLVIMAVEQIDQRVNGGGEREEAMLRKQLVELRLRYEMDDIGEQEYHHDAAEVTERLRALRAQVEEEAADARDV